MNKMVDLGLDIRSKKRTVEQYNVQALQLENQASQDSVLSGMDDFDDVGALLMDFPKDDLIDMYSINV